MQTDMEKAFFTYALVFQTHLTDGGEDVGVTVTYDSSILHASQIARLVGQFEQAVDQLIERAQNGRSDTLADLNLVSAAELDQFKAWNADDPEIVDACFHELFEKQARLRPDALAIRAWDGEFTYAELNDKANRLAYHLSHKFDVHPDELVHVCFDKSAWFFVSILAINKAGGAWVPLDPSHPAARQQMVVGQTKARLALTSPATAAVCNGLVETVIHISPAFDEELASSIPQAAAQVLKSAVKPSNAVYALFTSGSTGVPKGFVMEHASVCTSQTAIAKRLRLTPDVKILQFASYVFDLCIGEIVAPLITGACVNVPPEKTRMSLADLADFIREMEVNWAFLTPAFVRTMQPQDFPGLELLLLAGEAVGQDILDSWFGKVRLVNGWGPAETCVFSTLHEWQSLAESSVTVGRPVGGFCWIVDPEDPCRLVPAGCVGEVVIQGPTTTREYLADPAKTKATTLQASSLPDWAPRRTEQHWNRFYKSGDLCLYNADGTIEYVGRKDNMVKIRGLRVELGEIEHSIRSSLAGVQQVAVDIVQAAGGARLVAYFSFLNDSRTAGVDLDADLAGVFLPVTSDLQGELAVMLGKMQVALPRYMIPTTFIPCGYMPFITSTKLDRKRLREKTLALSQQEWMEYSLVASLHQAKRASFPARTSSSSSKSSPNTENNGNVTRSLARTIHFPSSLPSSTDTSIVRATVLRAAWALVLARYSNTGDICFGTTVSGRQGSVRGIANICGPVLATVPVRIRLDREATVLSFLSDVQKQAQDMVPYEQTGLQTISRLGPDAKAACDFSSLLVIQPAHIVTADSLTEAILTPITPETAAGEGQSLDNYLTYPLAVQGLLYQDHVDLNLMYDSSVLNEAQIQAMSIHLEQVINQLLAPAEQQLLGQVSLVGAWDLEVVLKSNETEPAQMPSITLHGLIEEQAAYKPDFKAIEAHDGSLTYKELIDAADRLAHYLALRYAIKPGSLIPICFDRSAWQYVAMIAVNRLGAAWVLLGTPSQNVTAELHWESIIARSAATVVLCCSRTADKMRSSARNIVKVCRELHQSLNSEVPRHSSASPDDTACVLFSDDQTKGVVVEHQNICSGHLAAADLVSLDQSHRVLPFSPQDPAHILPTLMPLLSGAVLCVPPPDLDMDGMVDFINTAGINAVILSPLSASAFSPQDAPEIGTLLLVDEEPLSTAYSGCDRWLGSANMFGCWASLETSCGIWRAISSSDGKRRRGTNLFVVERDDHERLAPVGCAGELLVQGPTVARGYFEEEHATGSPFIGDKTPWMPSSQFVARVFKTGYMARLCADGSVEYLGPKGVGHSPYSTEFHIRAKEIDPSVTTSRLLILSNGEVVALVDFDLQIGEQPDSLKKRVAKLAAGIAASELPIVTMPHYFIPLHGVSCHTLTMRLTTMTVEQLSAYRVDKTENATDFSASGGLEVELRKLWAQVLGLGEHRIGKYDNFLDVGGDSVRAIHLVSLARRNNMELTVADIFKNPRLAQMAAVARTLVPETESSKVDAYHHFSLLPADDNSDIVDDAARRCNVNVDSIVDVLPTTPLQSGLMALSKKQAGSYTARFLIKLPESIDVHRFQEAMVKTVSICPNLRTRIIMTSRGSFQIVLSEDAASVLHLSDATLAGIKSQTILDIDYGSPLFKYAFVSDDDGSHYLVWNLHHSVYDGWTVGYIFNILRQAALDQELPTPVPFAHYLQYTISTKQHACDFWRSQLTDVSPAKFPELRGSNMSDHIAKLSDEAKEACNFHNLLIIQPGLSGANAVQDEEQGHEFEISDLTNNNKSYHTYPLVFQCLLGREGRVDVSAAYDPRVLSDARAAAICGQFEHLIQQLATADGAMRLSDINMCSPRDLDQLMAWNSPALPAPLDNCVHDLILEQASRMPQREALYSTEECLSYEELDRFSQTLAGLLVDMGVRPESKVPICLEKSVWAVVAMVGIMRAGGAFVPLDPTHPEGRRREIIRNHLEANIIITSPHSVSSCQTMAPNIISLSREFFQKQTQQTDAGPKSPTQSPSPRNTAYVIFTSGSSGTPKGVVVEHQAGRFEGLKSILPVEDSTRRIFEALVDDLGTKLPSYMVPTVFLAFRQMPFNSSEKLDRKRLQALAQGLSFEQLAEYSCTSHVLNNHPVPRVSYGGPLSFFALTNAGPESKRYLVWDMHHSVFDAWSLMSMMDIFQRAFAGQHIELPTSFANYVRYTLRTPRDATENFWRSQLAGANPAKFPAVPASVRASGAEEELSNGLRFVDGTTENQNYHVYPLVLQCMLGSSGKVEIRATYDDRVLSEAQMQALCKDFERITSQLVMGDDGSTRVEEVRPVGELEVPAWTNEQDAIAARSEEIGGKTLGAEFKEPSSLIESELRDIWSLVLGLKAETIGVNDNFYHLGGDSIRIVTMAKKVREKYQVRLNLARLNSSGVTIQLLATTIRDFGSGSNAASITSKVDLMTEVDEAVKMAWRQTDKATSSLSSCGPPTIEPITWLPTQATVFLTGATGFLGTEILRQLLFSPRTKHIITLVRAASCEKGLERVTQTAQIAGWWTSTTPDLLAKLEVWTGDLGRQRLGLSTTQWDALETNVDAIIHNGATVNWNADLATLRAPNVSSTSALLRAALHSRAKMVFVSGGPKGLDTQADRAAVAGLLSSDGVTGYMRSKFVAESAVCEVASRLGAAQNRVSVVKPGLVIGSEAGGGVANTDDLVWRVVAGACAIGAYPIEPDTHWMYAADSEAVARTVLAQVFSPGAVEPFVDLQDGVSVPLFWASVNSALDVSERLVPLSWEEWTKKVLVDVEAVGAKHPLWAVQHFMTGGGLGVSVSGRERCGRSRRAVDASAVERAIVSNVRYLQSVGFIGKPGNLENGVGARVIGRSGL
ncbi:uncharacterized protein PgNI_08015 [Pyricularia grisea]|uniref:Carrier domain-containing protein n=1 Tax=Pyricularia grisea TaxID=148305 RepID=A0A6P8AWN1_PYRGI|nr:uncharacterized protein PgNI_08015 [Pyricularia grisea]TLD06610.1 hypothetical protein PgNI_08015 [Pyricularia grisea]